MRPSKTSQSVRANELELVYTGVLNGLYASTPLARRAPIKIGIEEPYRPQPNAPKETEPAGADPR